MFNFMGLSSLLPSFFAFLITSSIVISVILFHPSLPPKFDFESYDVEYGTLVGPYERNNRLNNAERLFEGKLKGPEHLIVHNGELYTTIHGGYVSKIVSKNSIEPIVKFGEDCDDWWQEELCGRPLGFKIDTNGTIYVADAYYGIRKFDPKTGTTTLIIDLHTEIEGKIPMIPNSLDIAKDGKIYWTDSSTTHKLHDGLLTLLGPPTGRLLVTDPVTQISKVLMNNIHFANGVHLSTDESYILVAETQRARIHRYWLKGKKAGTSEVFVDKLPGLPDNINHDGGGKFIVSLVDPGSHFTNALPQYPLLRKFLARIMTLAQLTVREINTLFPNLWLTRAHHLIGHFEMIAPLKVFDEPRATVLLINHEGQITNCLHATDGNVTSVSSMVIHNGYYYLGSPFNNYLARVKI
ncbi:hypothetical protein GE061_001049 [Apolygus lucorum]|uniref:Strictosidine synthase conserved region domain-containing protein n=1 Tax=Apolygus lucorum TaxID=248454 RepID=A0A8S9Y695_APOLU|nr:hypothetical protein GE061_001049 [Apolygus lucorum]